MVLFILIIVRCFSGIGRIEARTDVPLPVRRCVWAMGAALFAHAITYLSISYFDQNFVNWYLLLALISTTTGVAVTKPQKKPAAESQAQPAAGIGDEATVLAPVNFRGIQ